VTFHVLCFDASGSVKPVWGGIVEAARAYFTLRQESGGGFGDLVTIIQFNDAPRVFLDRVTLQHALNAPLPNTCSGVTNDVPALESCLSEIRKEPTELDTVLLFMTDGVPSDGLESKIILAVKALKRFKPALHFFCVGLKFQQLDRLKAMADAGEGQSIAAADIRELEEKFVAIARVVCPKHGR
jgi:hypothetical protein